MPFKKDSNGAFIKDGVLPSVGSTITLGVNSGGNVSSVQLNGLYMFVPTSNMNVAVGSGATANDVPIYQSQVPPARFFIDNAYISAIVPTGSASLHLIPLMTP